MNSFDQMYERALRAEAEARSLRECLEEANGKLALVKSKTALDVVAENVEAQRARRSAEAERDFWKRQAGSVARSALDATRGASG